MTLQQFTDDPRFQEALLAVRRHCSALMTAPGSPETARRLRSFNPVFKGSAAFTLKQDTRPSRHHQPVYYYPETAWRIKLLDGDVLERLLRQVLKWRREALALVPESAPIGPGRILLSEPDISVFDGASGAASSGLIDVQDIPPIDTWFYVIRNGGTRVLCSWIPKPFEQLAQAAIDVNVTDCLAWLE